MTNYGVDQFCFPNICDFGGGGGVRLVDLNDDKFLFGPTFTFSAVEYFFGGGGGGIRRARDGLRARALLPADAFGAIWCFIVQEWDSKRVEGFSANNDSF